MGGVGETATGGWFVDGWGGEVQKGLAQAYLNQSLGGSADRGGFGV